MDATNLLLVSDNLYRLSKKERANANTFDINEFLEPYVSPGLVNRGSELISRHVRLFGLQTPIKARL
jgi:hypothetical protein